MDTSSPSQCSLPAVQQSRPHIGGAIETSEATHAVCYVANLPVETMHQVFIEVLSEHLLEYPAFVCPDAVPVQLSHVCQSWRQVTTGMPALWATMYVNNHSSPSLVQMWLERSKGCLTLTVDIKNMQGQAPSRAKKQIYEMLLKHIYRWGTVEWIIKDLNTAENFLPCLVGERLNLTCDIDDIKCHVKGLELAVATLAMDVEAYENERRIELLGARPSSSNLDTRNPTPLLHILPLFQLTCLRLDCPAIPIDECAQLLIRCPKLVELVIGRIFPPRTRVQNMTPCDIQLLDLVSCTLHYHCNLELLALLKCPGLRVFAFYHDVSNLMNVNETTDISTFQKLLMQSGLALETFAIKDNQISENDLQRLLPFPALQSVEKITLSCERLSDETISKLTITADDSILPRLKFMELHRCCSSDCKFGQMIASRRDGMSSVGLALERVSVGFSVLSNEGHLTGKTEKEKQAIRNGHIYDYISCKLFMDTGLKAVIWVGDDQSDQEIFS